MNLLAQRQVVIFYDSHNASTILGFFICVQFRAKRIVQIQSLSNFSEPYISDPLYYSYLHEAAPHIVEPVYKGN